MTHPSTAESPVAWTADSVATLVSDLLAQNYFAPEGALADVGYEGPDETGACTVWLDSPGAAERLALIVVPVAAGGDQPTVRITTTG